MAAQPNIKAMYDEPPTLKEAQVFVAGYVELLDLPDGTQMLVNEEGKARSLPHNIPASLRAGQLIVGNVMWLIGKARWR